MAESDPESEPIQWHDSHEEPTGYRARREQARLIRWGRARAAAAGLMRRARDEASSEDGVMLRALTLLAEAVEVEHLHLIVLAPAADAARIYRARWSRDGCRATLEVLHAETRDVLKIRPVVIGAEVSFHALLYPSGGAQASGCLSALGSRSLSLTPDTVALIDATGEYLASMLFDPQPATPVPA